jgi:hypothetical protein
VEEKRRILYFATMSGEVLPFFAMDTKDCKFLLNNGYEIKDLHKLNSQEDVDLAKQTLRSQKCLHTPRVRVDDPHNCVHFSDKKTYQENLRALGTSLQAMVVNHKDFFVPENIQNIIFLKRNSVSDSVVLEAELTHPCKEMHHRVKVIMKWFKAEGFFERELLKEAKIYSCFAYNVTVPFFSYPLVIQLPCKNPTNTSSENDELVQQVKDEFKRRRRESTKDIGFMMTEHCGKTTLFDYMQENPRADANIYSAIVQVIVALKYLRKNKILHMDLHFGNIMFPESVEITQGNPELFLNTETGEVVHQPTTPNDAILKLNRVIKIFDWDNAVNRMDDEESRVHDEEWYDIRYFIHNLLRKYHEFSDYGEKLKETGWKNDLTEFEAHRLQAKEIEENENALYEYCVNKWKIFGR